MSVIEFCVFSGLIAVSAFLSVAVRSLLYAVFFQIQAAVAAAGFLAGLNASFAGFALTAATSAALLAFLIFALIVFDAFNGEKTPPESAKTLLLFFVLAAAEAGWLFFKPDWTTEDTSAAFPFFGGTLYASCGLCAAVFGTIVLSCLAGIATLTAAERGGK